MKEVNLELKVIQCRPAELNDKDRLLAEAARKACGTSYSPYSRFAVGAALRLSDGSIVTGSNQENAAYPSGMCAERVALYQAGAIHPTTSVEAMVIAAYTKGEFTPQPCPPCGACRQVMLETEERHGGKPIRLILYGTQECYIIEGGANAMLPLSFGKQLFPEVE